jgi:osmotically inducible protein OsmC
LLNKNLLLAAIQYSCRNTRKVNHSDFNQQSKINNSCLMTPTTASGYNGRATLFLILCKENVMQRKASAVWKGGLKDGKGTISAPGGVLNNTQYSFSTRFENAPGTNPEELIAAAHAGCFSMALSGQLGSANLTAESISTTVTLSLEKLDSGWTITASHIDVVGKVPGADAATFQKYAEAAEKGCPVSKVLNAKITMSAKLG